MDCREARALLDQGVEPGSGEPTRATLGFHLAGCPACRAYRADLHRLLLAELLFPEARAAAPRPPRRARRPRRPRPGERLARRVSLSLVAIAALLMVFVVGRATMAAITIRQNVQSYIVPTAAPVNAAAPAATERPAATQPPAVERPQLAVAPATAPPADATPSAGATPAPTRIPIVPTAIPGDGAAGAIPTLAPITATPVVPLAGSAVNILLLGSDRRPGEEGTSRTDTVIVLRVDPERKRVAMLSLPRDLIVEIPGYGYARINAAHVYGDLYPELGGGLSLARRTVSNLLGVPIDYAVLIDFEGFIGLIDAIGGIDIDVPTSLYDGAYPTMDYGYMEVYFEAGPQHMDGNRALQYARIRHADSDFERARRQQAVILAAVRRLRDQNPLQLLDSVANATSSLRGYVWTDLPEDRMIGLAWALRDVSPDSVERYLLDENMIFFGGPDDPYAEYAVPGAIESLVRQWLGQ